MDSVYFRVVDSLQHMVWKLQSPYKILLMTSVCVLFPARR